MSSVKEAHYEIISREKMLDLMQQYVDKTNNQIFISYYNYWNSKQNLVETFKTLPVVDWSWWAVYGFYDHCILKLTFWIIMNLRAIIVMCQTWLVVLNVSICH